MPITCDVLLEKAAGCLDTRPDILHSLSRYARELGVSVDHVIIGALQMVAEDYENATGNGAIPCLH